MPRNISEKIKKPILPGRPQYLMEPIRLDAQHGHLFEEYGSAGDKHYSKWCMDDRLLYDDIPDRVRNKCFKQWVAYYKAHPEESLALTGDDAPF